MFALNVLYADEYLHSMFHHKGKDYFLVLQSETHICAANIFKANLLLWLMSPA